MIDRGDGLRRLGGCLRRRARPESAPRSTPSSARALLFIGFALSALSGQAQAADPLSAALEKHHLLEPGESALTLTFWQNALREGAQLLDTEAGRQWLASASWTLALTCVSLLVGTVLSLFAARVFRANSERISAPAVPLVRLIAGIAAPLAVNWVLIEAMPVGLAGPSIETSLLATGITAVSLSAALAMLSPADKALRLLPIGTSEATAASVLSLIAVFIFGADIVFERAGGPPGGHEKLVAGASALMVFAVVALLLAGSRVFAKGHATASTAPVTSFPIKPESFSFLAAAIGIAAAGAALFGYLTLGWFLSVQLLWIATLFCVTYVVWAALNRLGDFYRDAVAHARASENSASLHASRRLPCFLAFRG